jgi:Flp pilus assembly protein TadG
MHGMRNIFKCVNGSAAAEMALVTPLLLTLMFGSFELGNYFLDNHVVEKAVRDGARYAARRSLSNYTACTGDPGGTVKADTQNLVRTGQVTSGGNARLPGWTSNSTITVTITCGSGYTGIYTGLSGAPVVTVTAAVPYSSLFQAIGFNASSLILNARAQAPVMGI